MDLIPAQERFKELTEKQNPAAHICLAFELKGDLQPAILEKAFQHVWSQTDVKSLRFQNWKLEVASDLSLQIKHHEMKIADAKTAMTKEATHPFDLTREIPLRLDLYKTKPNEYVLSLIAQHLMLDGWSVARLLEETCRQYNILLDRQIRDRQTSTSSNLHSYQNYIRTYQKEISQARYFESMSYWKEQKFINSITETQKKTDGHRIIYLINKKIHEKVKLIGKEHKATPFMILLTAFSLALQKLIKNKQYVLSVPIASRDWEDADRVIGNCVNLMPFQIDLTSSEDFINLLAANKKQFLRSMPHALVDYREIEKAQQMNLSEYHFNFEPAVEEPELKNVKIDFYPFPIKSVEKSLIINVTDTKKNYYVEIDFQFSFMNLIQGLSIFTDVEKILNKLEVKST